MFKAMISHHQHRQPSLEEPLSGGGTHTTPTSSSYNPYFSSHPVASALAQIGVDPGYFSDSECSSNSSDKTDKTASEEKGRGAVKNTSPKAITPPYSFVDYFGFPSEVVRSGMGGVDQGADVWKQPMAAWSERQSPLRYTSGSTSSDCLSPLSETSSSPQIFPHPNHKKPNARKNKAQVCVFCRNNGEDEAVYSTHALKDAEGRVTCPILFAYECPICKETGENSHTLKYCPRNPNGQAAQLQQRYTTADPTGFMGSNRGNTMNTMGGPGGMSYIPEGNTYNTSPFQIMAQNYGHLSSDLNYKLASLLQQQHQHKQQQQQQQQQQTNNPWYNNTHFSGNHSNGYGIPNSGYSNMNSGYSGGGGSNPSNGNNSYYYSGHVNGSGSTGSSVSPPSSYKVSQQQQQDQQDHHISQLFGKVGLHDIFQSGSPTPTSSGTAR